MDKHGSWRKTFLWGAVTAALYVALFYYADLLLHMAHTTPDACIVGNGADTLYYHRMAAGACAEAGGQFVTGTWWHVLPIILIAFAISYTHGAFTGLFWEMMGLRPAGRK